MIKEKLEDCETQKNLLSYQKTILGFLIVLTKIYDPSSKRTQTTNVYC